MNDPYAGERLKLSHFHDRQALLNLRDAWSAWNGYKFADCYYDTEYEYFCVRNQCGTYDICPMQKYIIEGPQARAMLNRLVTRNIDSLGEDRVTYVCWCTSEGRVIDDGTIFRLGPEKYMLTCGSSSLAWLKKASFGFSDLTITDMSDDIAALNRGTHAIYPLSKPRVAAAFLAAPFRFGTQFWKALGSALFGPREHREIR